MMAKNDLDPAVVRSLLAYMPDTGELVWKKSGKIAGGIARDGYRVLGINHRRYLAHRIVWLLVYGEWPDQQVDHINNVRSDNRIANLRLATNQQNQANARLRKDNSSGYRGVSYRYGRWLALIRVDGVLTTVGRFRSREEAAEAYKKKSEEKFGQFAKHCAGQQ